MDSEINFTAHDSKIRTIKPGDKRFIIQDKFTMAHRAGFEIDAGCPAAYRSIIVQCYNKGWLKPVANVTEREMIFMGLSDEQSQA